MQIEVDDPYSKLRPPAPTAPEEMCSCPADTPLVLQSHLSPNPLACARCNLEVPPEMTNRLSFGDNVRVRPTPETSALGLAGANGQIYGVTTPSETGIEVVGELAEDCAFAVQFPDRADAVWFPADLLELIDHAPGTEIRIGGSARTWRRTDDGSWVKSGNSRPWWKFW